MLCCEKLSKANYMAIAHLLGNLPCRPRIAVESSKIITHWDFSRPLWHCAVPTDPHFFGRSSFEFG
jgi:hypothetical protein